MGTQTNQLEKETKATVSKQRRNSTGDHISVQSKLQQPDRAQKFIEDWVSLDAARKGGAMFRRRENIPWYVSNMKFASRSTAAARSALTGGWSSAVALTRLLVLWAESHTCVQPSPSGQGLSVHISLGPQTASRKRPHKEDLTKGHSLLLQQQCRGTAGTAFESSSPHSTCLRHRPEDDKVQAPLGVCRRVEVSFSATPHFKPGLQQSLDAGLTT